MSGVDTRHISRDSLFLLADIRLGANDNPARVKVRNLSGGGMMAEGDVAVQSGMQLSINLRNIGWVEGSVAWVQDERFGIAFAREIDPAKARAKSEEKVESSAPDYLRSSHLRGGDTKTLRKI